MYCKPQDYNLIVDPKKVLRNHKPIIRNIILSNLAFVHIIQTTNSISLGIN